MELLKVSRVVALMGVHVSEMTLLTSRPLQFTKSPRMRAKRKIAVVTRIRKAIPFFPPFLFILCKSLQIKGRSHHAALSCSLTTAKASTLVDPAVTSAHLMLIFPVPWDVQKQLFYGDFHPVLKQSIVSNSCQPQHPVVRFCAPDTKMAPCGFGIRDSVAATLPEMDAS